MYPEKAQSERVHRLDRLYVVVAVLLAVGACEEDEGSESGASRGARVNAVKAQKKKAVPPQKFCDRYFTRSDAGSFRFPELNGETPELPEGWAWVNVWATWCKPCVEEMPRLVKWNERLSDGKLGGLVLISADESRQKVESFRKKHSNTPESSLLAQPNQVESWAKSIGFDTGAPLPIHVFVDSSDRIRCLRAGGIGKDEFRSVQRLLEG